MQSPIHFSLPWSNSARTRSSSSSGRNRRGEEAPVVENPLVENTLKKLRRLTRRGSAPGPALPIEYIEDIDFSTADQAYKLLLNQGFKLRFNWSGPERTASFKMLSPLHELPASWLVSLLPTINNHLREVAPCGIPSIHSKGSGGIVLDKPSRGEDRPLWEAVNPKPGYKREPSRCEPDASLYLQYHKGPDEIPSNIGIMPRVVMETAYSEGIKHALDKACDYLYSAPGDNIHAVIICDLSYLQSKEDKFQSRISVWVRPETGTPEVDYPIDECRLENKDAHHVYPVPPDSHSDGGSLRSSHSGVGEKTYCHSGAPGQFKILNRSGWQTIWNEPADAPVGADNVDDQGPSHLELNFYDFVRVCDYKPYDLTLVVPAELQDIRLPLDDLRQQLKAELKAHRGQLTDSAGANPTQSAPAQISRSALGLLGRFRRRK